MFFLAGSTFVLHFSSPSPLAPAGERRYTLLLPPPFLSLFSLGCSARGVRGSCFHTDAVSGMMRSHYFNTNRLLEKPEKSQTAVSTELLHDFTEKDINEDQMTLQHKGFIAWQCNHNLGRYFLPKLTVFN